MRTVKIDGVTLTEEQVRKALAELNIPVKSPSAESLHFRRVKRSKGNVEGIVIFGFAQRMYAEAYDFPESRLLVIERGGGTHSFRTVEHLLAVWSLIDE